MAKKWLKAAPWTATQDLIDKIGRCASCGAAARWCLVSEETAFAFCGPCTCRWAHPDGPVDPGDPWHCCPQCSLVDVSA